MINAEKMKALADELRKGSSGRYRWYAMGRDETSYFMDFDWGYDADRWLSDQQKSRAAWIEQEGIHIVKKLFQTELETNAAAAADAIDLLLAEVEAAAADTARLEFLIDQQVWVQWTVRDGSIRQCQVYDQDEDENYHILSGDDRYFNTPRDAIDAALAQRQGEGS